MKRIQILKEFMQNVYLDNKEKSKLIEIMLIVTTILSTFSVSVKASFFLQMVIILFLIISIFYWIFLNIKIKTRPYFIRMIMSSIISLLFAASISESLGITLLSYLSTTPTIHVLIEMMFYYLIISFGLSYILRREKDDGFSLKDFFTLGLSSLRRLR